MILSFPRQPRGRRKPPLASQPPVILRFAEPEASDRFTVQSVPAGKSLRVAYFAAGGPRPHRETASQTLHTTADGSTFVFGFADVPRIAEQG